MTTLSKVLISLNILKANSILGPPKLSKRRCISHWSDLTWSMRPRFRARIFPITLKKWKWCRDVLQGMCASAGTILAVIMRWLATSAGSPSLYMRLNMMYRITHVRLRGMPGRGGWCHPPVKLVGSIRGGIFHWARPMTHTNSHSYPPPSPFGTASHLTFSPPPPWTPSIDNSRTCKRQGFLNLTFIFTAPFFFVYYNLLFYF